jgi:integrase
VSEVTYEKDELDLYVQSACRDVVKQTANRIRKIAGFIWEQTQGIISHDRLRALYDYFVQTYPSDSSRQKCFIYTRAFMKYLQKTRFDPRLTSYLAVFEKPKAKTHKILHARIVTKQDIRNTLTRINEAELSPTQNLQYRSLILFLAYSGQRVVTASRITVKQIREALRQDPPVLTVEPEQDKIRMQHYVPLHPVIVPLLTELIAKRADDELAFSYTSLMRWLRNNPVELTRDAGKMDLMSIRKGFEQISDHIGFVDAHKNYIMSHGVSSVNWAAYKKFLPEDVYAIYMQYWGAVQLEEETTPEPDLRALRPTVGVTRGVARE